MCSLDDVNSDSLRSIEHMISKLEHMTPHLLADESLTILTAASSKSFCLAPGVINKFAPSTISCDDGMPSGRRKAFQLSSLIVAGRPPAGINASATTRLCMVFLARCPSMVLDECRIPLGPISAGLKSLTARSSRTKRASSWASRPSGSSADPDASARPTTKASSPYSRARILSMFPATSPSGPPVIFTVKGRPVVLGCMPISLSAVSRNT
mmetsp:Transcript_21900/g.29819  ORF Transcript_21900/g.29819 Transcript_21900/m.29819 type:complete len:211 (-) Transcript_21900:11-643(-)